MANKPENIFVGICQQNKESSDDKDCLDSISNFKYKNNVRIKRIPHTEAKGPTYARYICSTLYKDEKYYLQIDSHSKFVKDWDIKCINMIIEIKEKKISQKPVLSHYPREISEHKDHKENDTTLPRICKPFFNNRDMISFMASEILDTKGEYYLTPFVAGGMVFSESYFLKELPYDPNLPYIFVGEEILHSIRYYTNGWDVFTPKENIIFHEYTRSEKPKIWTDNPYYSDMDAFNKIRYLIGLDADDSKLKSEMKIDLDKYGLGKVRTLQQYYELTGIDVKNKIVTKNFCREGNVASENDIKRSYEKRWEKEEWEEKEENTSKTKNYWEWILSLKQYKIVFTILIIISIIFAIKIGYYVGCKLCRK
jgi:UDP-GlcNAc:polypeptide alpha-N-acetylglucosaminyltransferase